MKDQKEYIERGSIYRRVKTHTNPYGKPTLDYESGVKVLDMIKQEPAADVVEVRHGEWILKWRSTLPQYEPNEYECSVCGMKRSVKHNYCPRCGAKMDGERKEQNGV